MMNKLLYRLKDGVRTTLELDLFKNTNDVCILKSTYSYSNGISGLQHEKIIDPTKTKTAWSRGITILEKKAKDKITKQGYTYEESGISSIVTVTLAEQYDKHKKNLRYDEGVIGLIKLDGIRTRLGIDKVMYSRSNEVQVMPHISEAFETIRLPYAIEGELWAPGFTIEEISSMISHQDERIGLYLFDFMSPTMYFKERLQYLERLKKALTNNANVHIVPYSKLESEREGDEAYAEALRKKFEGLIYRNAQDLYETKRTRFFLKRKPLNRSEHRLDEIGYDNDAKFGKLIKYILFCEKARKTFKVVPKDKTKPERAAMYENATVDDYGKLYSVESRGFTKYGVPKHGVGIGFRGDI